LNFTSNPATGDISKVVDVNAVKQALISLVSTNFNERLFRPKLGTGIRGLLFENVSPMIAVTLQKIIEQTITNYEPRVGLDRVDVQPSVDSNSYSVAIYYTVRGVDAPQTLSLNLRRLR
jgi:hypothetical protein